MESRSSDRRDDAWLASLRSRFLGVACRRVREEDVEDVVQEAMRVVHARGSGLVDEEIVDGLPPIAWCFQVLRHTIGNHYKRTRRRESVLESRAEFDDTMPGSIDGRTPAEALETDEVMRTVEAALGDLEGSDTRCHEMLREVMAGTRVRELAERAGVEEPVFSRRLYRCRQKLRAQLRAKGVLP